MLRKAASAALGLLYPARCLGCGRFGALLCTKCEAAMEPATGAGRCPHCRALWDGEANCPRCFHLQALDAVLAAFEMDGPARKVVHALKYRYIAAAAPVMAKHVAPLGLQRPFDRFFAVPLHPSRHRARGFNQAELLARAAGWEPAQGLVRKRKTEHQVGMHERQRRANVAGAFEYQGPPLQGLRVALIDDVITTGATMQECAQILRDAGAREVWGVAFARASYRFGADDAAIDD